MSTTEPAETIHVHVFPCNPPGGTYLHPGPCVCGKTYGQALREAQEAMAATEETKR